MVVSSEERIDEDVRAWLEVLDELDHYELFGIGADASADELKLAFHRFAESFHPDRHRQKSKETRDATLRIFRRGAESYRILSDAVLRRRYDLDLVRAREKRAGDLESAKSLEELCLTPGGRLHGRQAERALSEGDLERAVELIDRALVAEGPTPSLLARKQAVSDALELSSAAPGLVEVVIPDTAAIPRELGELRPRLGTAPTSSPPPASGERVGEPDQATDEAGTTR